MSLVSAPTTRSKTPKFCEFVHVMLLYIVSHFALYILPGCPSNTDVAVEILPSTDQCPPCYRSHLSGTTLPLRPTRLLFLFNFLIDWLVPPMMFLVGFLVVPGCSWSGSWLFLVISGCSWLFLVVSGRVPGYFWLFLVVSGRVPGYFWLFLVAFLVGPPMMFLVGFIPAFPVGLLLSSQWLAQNTPCPDPAMLHKITSCTTRCVL
jgi:hypothetical protein